MYGESEYKLPSALIQAIEDAVLFGHTREISGVLELIKEIERFPENLRNGLEALLYFRLHYGKGGILEPVEDKDRLKVAQMEVSWGREVIEMLGHAPDMTESKYAYG